MIEVPMFSIVVPCYNYGHYLEETLDSISGQARSDIQVVLIDDASTDQTPLIAARHAGWIEYIRNESNLGAGGAWSKGLVLARGLYVMKLDADDKLLPGFCDAMQAAFEKDPDVGAAISSVILNKETIGKYKPQYVCDEDRVISADAFRDRLLRSFFFRMPGCMLRRELLVGHALPDPDLYQIHDWEYFLRVTKGHKAALIRQPHAEYRIHGSSITATAQKNNRLYRDIQRWLAKAKEPGDHYLEPDELKVLRGSCAQLLLIGFGPKWKLTSYTNYFLKYLHAVRLASNAGLRQLIELHGTLLSKIFRHVTFTAET